MRNPDLESAGRYQRAPLVRGQAGLLHAVAWSLVAASLATALTLGGTAPLGRLALTLGLNGLAQNLLEDPFWRGIAHYRSGDHEQAAEAFRQAGPRASFNRGNALALSGRYNEAVDAYDAVIYRNPDDREAHFNRALVARFATLVIGEAQAEGRTRAGAAFENQAAKGVGPKKVPDAPLRHEDIAGLMRKLYKGTAFLDRSVAASRQWLASLPDEPGRYLKQRIAAEQQRRIDLGLSVVPSEDPW